MKTKKILSNNQDLKNNIIKRRKGIFVLLLLLISVISQLFPSTNHLEGKWYLYNDSPINKQFSVSELSNLKDYIIISDENIESCLSENKNLVSSYDLKGRKLYLDNSIFKYEISEVQNKKLLTLELIGFTTPNTIVESLEISTYVLDEDFSFN